MSPTSNRDVRELPPVVCPLRTRTSVEFDTIPPQVQESDGASTWIVRAARFITVVTRAAPGTRLERHWQPDEYMVISPPACVVEISAGGATVLAPPDSLTIVPPGDSELTVQGHGHLCRIFSQRATDLLSRSLNAARYADGAPEVNLAEPWPEPLGGFRIRNYPLTAAGDHTVFGRIYRSTNLMVNLLEPFATARDPSQLSPHVHDDFEQGSLTLSGDFEHYLRTPWGTDRAAWRADETLRCGSPSLTVIPARTIHTTWWSGGGARMVDIFSPPRLDFSRKPGWVRNEHDYPLPAENA